MFVILTAGCPPLNLVGPPSSPFGFVAQNTTLSMSFASLSAPMGALAVFGLLGWIAATVAFLRLRKGEVPSDDADGYGSYKLLLDTLDRSNILLWWARVKRVGTSYEWTIRTPPKLHDNSIYLLAGERDSG